MGDVDHRGKPPGAKARKFGDEAEIFVERG
jgi:hypothetical protein